MAIYIYMCIYNQIVHRLTRQNGSLNFFFTFSLLLFVRGRFSLCAQTTYTFFLLCVLFLVLRCCAFPLCVCSSGLLPCCITDGSASLANVCGPLYVWKSDDRNACATSNESEHYEILLLSIDFRFLRWHNNQWSSSSFLRWTIIFGTNVIFFASSSCSLAAKHSWLWWISIFRIWAVVVSFK